MVVTFDLDDTLYDELDFVDSGFRAVARELTDEPARQAELVAEMRRVLAAEGSGRVFDAVLARFGLTADVRRLVEVYRGHRPDLALDPARRAVLVAVHARHRTALVTDGPAHTQRAKFDALGLAELVDVPIFSADLATSKPSPLPFQAVARAFPSESSFVYVGDNPAKDFQAPRALGWRTVRFRNPRGLHRDVPGDADVTIDRFEALLLHLEPPSHRPSE